MKPQELENTQKQGIYDYDVRIQRTFKLIRSELSGSNQQLIEKYDKVMISESLAKATRHKHLQVILNLSRFLNKDWNLATKDDVDNVVVRIMQQYSGDSGQETYTTYDHKKILKIFFRWFKNGSRSKEEVQDPIEIKDVKLKKVKDKIVREDLITEDDLSKLLHSCKGHPRDKALIDCHSEASTRPGEILSLKIKHVQFDNYGAIIKVDGKTGPRPIRLIRSTPNLSTWLNAHPKRDDPDAPLWIELSRNKLGRPLTYFAAYQMLRRRCKQANLPKRVYLNLFRHSGATDSAKYMTEAQMKKRHGWSQDSKMPGRYVHLVNADVDEAVLKHHGIIKKSDEIHAQVPKMCTICKNPNAWDSKLCTQCGKPLDLEAALDAEEKHQKKEQWMEDELKRQSQSIEYLLSLIPQDKK